jgi:hypothetical protein
VEDQNESSNVFKLAVNFQVQGNHLQIREHGVLVYSEILPAIEAYPQGVNITSQVVINRDLLQVYIDGIEKVNMAIDVGFLTTDVIGFGARDITNNYDTTFTVIEFNALTFALSSPLPFPIYLHHSLHNCCSQRGTD